MSEFWWGHRRREGREEREEKRGNRGGEGKGIERSGGGSERNSAEFTNGQVGSA